MPLISPGSRSHVLESMLGQCAVSSQRPAVSGQRSAYGLPRESVAEASVQALDGAAV